VPLRTQCPSSPRSGHADVQNEHAACPPLIGSTPMIGATANTLWQAWFRVTGSLRSAIRVLRSEGLRRPGALRCRRYAPPLPPVPLRSAHEQVRSGHHKVQPGHTLQARWTPAALPPPSAGSLRERSVPPTHARGGHRVVDHPSRLPPRVIGGVTRPSLVLVHCRYPKTLSYGNPIRSWSFLRNIIATYGPPQAY